MKTTHGGHEKGGAPREGEDGVHHQEAHLAPHGAARHGRDDGAAVARGDGAGAHGARRKTAAPAGPAGLHRDGARLGRRHDVRRCRRTCGRRPRSGAGFDLSPTSLSAARAVPRLPDHRQQHRRAERRGVRAAGDRRRSLPLERGVPDPGASEADAGLGRPRRHVDRSALRAEVRAGHADSVDAAVHRERRSGRRLRLRLLLRLHRHDQLGDADDAAADDSRSALAFDQLFGVGATPKSARARADDKSILDWISAQMARLNALGAADRAAARRLPRRRPRDRAAHPEGRSAQHQRRAARAAGRRPACPIRSTSTSS